VDTKLIFNIQDQFNYIKAHESPQMPNVYCEWLGCKSVVPFVVRLIKKAGEWLAYAMVGIEPGRAQDLGQSLAVSAFPRYVPV